jgi:hypothetical protein
MFITLTLLNYNGDWMNNIEDKKEEYKPINLFSKGTNFSIAQGIQQPYEISISVGIELKEINLELAAYPNPTTNNLTLKIGNITLG